MTDRGQDWHDPERVDRWVAKDARRSAVQSARDLAVGIVALDARPAMVVELAAGAGTFLATFLHAFPEARGLWSDSSHEMARHARMTLSPFEDRVDYRVADMRDPGLSPASVDVLICARATHGLDATELDAFYGLVASVLRPGGWLVNLDHVAVDEPWSNRYDQVTSRFYDDETESRAAARKDRGGHTLDVHVDALTSVGLTELDTPWRLLSTVLLLARRPVSPPQ